MIEIAPTQMEVVEAICASDFSRSVEIARLIGVSRSGVDNRLCRMARAMGICTAPSKVIGIVRSMGVAAFVVADPVTDGDDGPPFPYVRPTAAWLSGPDFSHGNMTFRR